MVSPLQPNLDEINNVEEESYEENENYDDEENGDVKNNENSNVAAPSPPSPIMVANHSPLKEIDCSTYDSSIELSKKYSLRI